MDLSRFRQLSVSERQRLGSSGGGTGTKKEIPVIGGTSRGQGGHGGVTWAAGAIPITGANGEPTLTQPVASYGGGKGGRGGSGGGGRGGVSESAFERDADGNRVDKNGNPVGNRINARPGHANEDRIAADQAENERLGLFDGKEPNGESTELPPGFNRGPGVTTGTPEEQKKRAKRFFESVESRNK